MAFIAGQYTVTYGGSTVGQIANGITIEHTVLKRLITGDNHAEAPQDAVYRGEHVFAQFTLLEYNATSAKAAFWPYGATYLTGGIRGRLDSAIYAALVLTALAGTPAAATPASATLSKSILAEGYPVGILFAPDLREVPIRQRVYPNDSYVYGTLT